MQSMGTNNLDSSMQCQDMSRESVSLNKPLGNHFPNRTRRPKSTKKLNFKQNRDAVDNHLCFTTSALSQVWDSLREGVCDLEAIIDDNFFFKASTTVCAMVVTVTKWLFMAVDTDGLQDQNFKPSISGDSETSLFPLHSVLEWLEITIDD